MEQKEGGREEQLEGKVMEVRPGMKGGLSTSCKEFRFYFILNKIYIFKFASQVAQAIKNLPAMQDTWIPFLGWEVPLQEGMATHSSILAWRISMNKGA